MSSSLVPSKGSEAEFLQQISIWQPCATVIQERTETEVQKAKAKKAKAGPSSRQASVGGAISATSSKRYFIYLESYPSSISTSPSSSSSSSSPCLRLLCSDVSTVWCGELDLLAFRRHREGLGIAAVGWREIMAMLRNCIEEGRVSVNIEGATLVVQCRYQIGSEVELEGRFTINRVDDDEDDDQDSHSRVSSSSSSSSISTSPSSSSRLNLLTYLFFAVFTSSTNRHTATIQPLKQEVLALQTELTALRRENSTLRSENSAFTAERSLWLTGSSGSSSSNGGGSGSNAFSSSFDGHSSAPFGVGPSNSSDPSRSLDAKRKQPSKSKGMSILNPNSKRRKLGGFKIE